MVLEMRVMKGLWFLFKENDRCVESGKGNCKDVRTGWLKSRCRDIYTFAHRNDRI